MVRFGTQVLPCPFFGNLIKHQLKHEFKSQKHSRVVFASETHITAAACTTWSVVGNQSVAVRVRVTH